ncbi:MAG: UDP-N-acetylmuramate--L-alanine ligase [Alphaproteobacteria bacterium]
MAQLPRTLGAIHFVGIGGIGMSGIAEVLATLGYTVRGSDMAESPNVERLRGLGIEIMIGHEAAHVAGVEVVVISSAVKADNPEVMAARAARIPVVRRAEMLAELMRLRWSIAVGGTHGKTTTTSLIAAILDGAGLDPTVINGGIIHAYGSNARLGEGPWAVAEADESDGTFTRLPATAAVVTNIDPEHLDHYGNFENVKAAFHTFVEQIPFYGFAAMCTDDPDVQALVAKVRDRRILTYGLNTQADITARNLTVEKGVAKFDLLVRATGQNTHEDAGEISLAMPGKHNVQNALGAIAVAEALEIDREKMRAALAGFSGVARRFTRAGAWKGATFIDDYGHHPVEVTAALSAAREAFDGRVIAVVQPHRYTRLQSLFDDFCRCMNDADQVLVAPVFAAGEALIEGATHEDLARGLVAHGHGNVTAMNGEGAEALAELVRDDLQEGDVVVCLGAGSVGRWAHDLQAVLEQGQ